MSIKLLHILIFTCSSIILQAQSKKNFTKIKNNVLIYNYEVSVKEYLEFIKSQSSPSELMYNKVVFEDTSIFGNLGAKADAEYIFDKYFSDDGANPQLPIVGISASQAEEFCKWLTSKLNSSGQFKGKIKEVRLPTVNEYYSVLLNDTIDAEFNPVADNQNIFTRANEIDINVYTNLVSINLTKTIASEGFKENLSGLEDGFVYQAPVDSYKGKGCKNLIGNVSEFVYSDNSKSTIIPIGNNFTGQIHYQGKLLSPEYLLFDKYLLADKIKWESPSAKVGFRFVVILK